MDRESFMFYKSYRDAGQMIPEEDRLKFYEIIFEYGLTGKEPEDTGNPLIDMALKFIRPLIKANIQNYVNGKKGGAPKGTVNNPTGKNQYEDNQKQTDGKPTDNRKQTDGKGNVKVKDKVKDKVTVKDKEKVNVNVNVNEKETYIEPAAQIPFSSSDEEDEDDGPWLTGEELLEMSRKGLI